MCMYLVRSILSYSPPPNTGRKELYLLAREESYLKIPKYTEHRELLNTLLCFDLK